MPTTTAQLPPERDPTTPAYQRPEVEKATRALTLIDDLLAGPEQMESRSAAYIRPWPNEKPEVYEMRRNADACFGGLLRTINAGVGMLWGKEPSITWGPPAREDRQRAIWYNIDGAGTKGSVLSARLSRLVLAHGYAFLLVDHPPQPVDENGNRIAIHAGNEAEYNLRPVVSLYTRRQLVSWRSAVERGVLTTTQLVFREETSQNVDEFGVATQVHYRRLYLSGGRAHWTRYREERDKNDHVIYVEDGTGTFTNRVGQTASKLPVAVAVAGDERAPFVVDPPLLGVAYANLGHWRYSCELAFNRKLSAYEQLVVSGEIRKKRGNASEDIEIGPLKALVLAQGGTATWQGPSGKGLDQLRQGVDEKLGEMDKLGIGFLLPQARANATATETRLDSYAQLASLVQAGKNIQDALNVMHEWVAWYDGAPAAEAAVMTINTNFEAGSLDAGVMNAYVALVKAGFPRRVVLVALQEGGRIPADADLDLLALEWEASVSADAEMERLRAENAMDNENDDTSDTGNPAAAASTSQSDTSTEDE